MKEKKISIVGGAGFLGTRLEARLKKSNILCKIYDKDHSHKAEENSCLDIEVPESLERLSGAEAFINLAAEHRDDIRPLSRYDDVTV